MSRSAPLAGHASAATANNNPTTCKAKGWWARHRWLILRRLTQSLILAAFVVGPVGGVWLLKGNLSASLVLETVPMTDWFVFLQTIAAGYWPETTAIVGVGIVATLYLTVGGRAYCAWVCPINPVTDAAAWLRRQLGLKGGHAPKAALRFWLLGAVLLASLASGVMVWEWVNPVSWTHRALIFGVGLAWLAPVAIFFYDLLLAPRGWCGHVCPQGAAYSLLGKAALVRVSAANRRACDDCMDCFTVCPEPQVIRPALKAEGQSHPLILSEQCTTCGRCIDVCDKSVFRMTHRFDRREP